MATPCPLVFAVATFAPSTAKTTEAPPKGVPPPSRVAEKVTAVIAGDGFALGVTVRLEEIRLTVTGTVLHVLAVKLVSPEYVQVMLSAPTGSAEVVNVAALPVSVTVESAVPLLEKVTVPVGVKVSPSTSSFSEPPMAADKVTADPAVVVVGVTVSVLVLGPWLTVSVSEALALV